VSQRGRIEQRRSSFISYTNSECDTMIGSPDPQQHPVPPQTSTQKSLLPPLLFVSSSSTLEHTPLYLHRSVLSHYHNDAITLLPPPPPLQHPIHHAPVWDSDPEVSVEDVEEDDEFRRRFYLEVADCVLRIGLLELPMGESCSKS
jgi:hypothetical protein